jgi:hypothetical protein
MLGSLGAPASSTTKTGRHDITERRECTLFCYVHSWVLTHAVLLLVIDLYELLDPAQDIGQVHTR